MPELLTHDQIQAGFDAASAAGVSPCNWIPKPWGELPTVGGKKALPSNCSNESSFDNTVPPAERIRRGKEKDEQPLDTLETPPNDFQWVHPFGNFAHVDNTEFSSKDISVVAAVLDPGRNYPRLKAVGDLLQKKRGEIMTKLSAKKEAQQRFDVIISVLQGSASAGSPALGEIAKDLKEGPIFSAIINEIQSDPKAEKAFTEVRDLLNPATQGVDSLDRLSALNRLGRIVGPASPGMQRLGRVFEWTLYRTTELLGEINKAVEAQDEARYEELRQNYIEFLRDLDDHEPPRGNQKLDPREKDYKQFASGYGRSAKWACIEPEIFEGQITGVRVVIRWNPHSSSNGVPVEHQ